METDHKQAYKLYMKYYVMFVYYKLQTRRWYDTLRLYRVLETCTSANYTDAYITKSWSANYLTKSRGSSVSIVTRLRAGQSGLDSRQGQLKRFSPSHTQGSDQLWGPPSLLSNGHHGLFPRECSVNVKLTSHLHLVPSLKMRAAIPLNAIRLHDVVLS
jgi:hypothetical protein